MMHACFDPIFHVRHCKRRRVVEPATLPDNAVLYRSDGAAHGQGHNGEIRSGAGAVFYGTGSDVEAWKCVHLDGASNNVAEYVGALLVLHRIARVVHERSVLQMDSMLVTNQLCGRWRIVAPDLVPYFREASTLINRIRAQGARVDFEHIYREFNKDADSNANLGADGTHAQHMW